MYNSAMRSSYSDDYTRRKAIIRAEQPALLTDRNAYVNFLEVQLERVSSACMSVQAYDQKFTDMQAMIIGLEQRSSSTTRLVSLSQQCIEELRANVFTEIEKQAQRSTAMHTELQRSVQILNSKLNTVEEGLHSVSSLPMKVTALEREIARLNLAIQSVDDMTKKSFKDVDIRIDPIESNVADALQSITSLQAAVSRQGLDTSELERRQSNSLMTLENKTAELMSNDRDEVARKLQNLSNKVNYEFENMDKNNHSREAKMMGAIKSDFKAAQEEMHLVRSALEGQIKSSATTVEAAFQSDLNDLRKLTDDRCDNLNGLIQSVKESHDSSVRENAESLRDFASSIQGLAGVQSETTEALDHLRNALSDPSQNIVVSEEAQVDQEITKIMGALSVASQERGRPGAAAAQAKQEVTAPRDAQVASLVPLPASSTGAGLQPRSNQQAVRTSVAASAPTQAKQLVGRKDSVREQPRNAPAGGPTVIADADPELTSSAWLEKVSQPDPSAEASEAGPTADEQELFRQFMVMYKRNSNQPAMQEQLSAGSNPNTNTSSATAAAPVPDSCSSLELSDTEEERAPTVSRSRKPKSSPNEVLRPENYVSSTQAKYLLPKPTPPWVPAKVLLPPLHSKLCAFALLNLCALQLFFLCSTCTLVTIVPPSIGELPPGGHLGAFLAPRPRTCHSLMDFLPDKGNLSMKLLAPPTTMASPESQSTSRTPSPTSQVM